MNVLGLNTMENASAALVMDGRIVAAAEEERFTRAKHQEGVPVNGIKYCLEAGGISLAEVDVVALNWQPWRLYRRVAHVLKYALTSPRQFLYKAKRGARQVSGNEWGRMMTLPKRLPALLGLEPDRKKYIYEFKFIDHHLCHAASAFYPSPFPEAAILTLDGAGEAHTITFNYGNSGEIRRMHAVSLPHSLGHLYSATTAFLGFRPCSGEGKVMGLASYGEPGYADYFDGMVRLGKNGRIRINFNSLDYHMALQGIFSPRVQSILGAPREKESEMEKRYEDIAASLQQTLENAALHLARHLHAETGSESLCLAGGVALNARMNQRLLEDTPFKNIFIQPAANDAGTSLGAALAVSRGNGTGERFPLHHVYLGPGFNEKEILSAIQKKGLNARQCKDISRDAAGLIAEGKIVGWFQGRMEFGPRALGNRSILADPRKTEMKDILNYRVKHREPFRPFAPAVLEERATEYFSSPENALFMTRIAEATSKAKSEIPAVVHVDGTARLQTVARDRNELFYGLIEHFEKLTGIPVVINTSFNIRGEPIVCTPEDAINCFLGTGMDALAMGDFLIVKSNEKHPDD